MKNGTDEIEQIVGNETPSHINSYTESEFFVWFGVRGARRARTALMNSYNGFV